MSIKINSSGAGQPPSDVGEASGPEKASGKEFAGKLDKAESVAAPTAPQSRAADTEKAKTLTGDIGAELEAGTLTPEAALDKVVDRVLDNQLGPDASPKLRSQVETFVRDKIESDPVLGEKIRSLSG